MEQNKTQVFPKATASQGGTSRPNGTRPERARPRPARPKKKIKKFPGWAKALIITGLLFSSLIFGMMIGYSFIGNGPIGDVFSFSAWKHILDLIIG